ncbi:amino acid adenylation domain-containing protein [Sphingomonas sp. MMS12-HWE2-04]|uniref:non-ribosomal peptide synthetase n=1 Tax=Sphingomonas sp. MMS12-HWE2-04 TaxID=3234199 RepID=UPI00384E85E8
MHADPKDAKELLKRQLKAMVRERIGVTGGWHPLSAGQEALWFQWRLAPAASAYTMVLPATIRGDLDPGALRRALQALSDRHACLRLEFREEDSVVRQRARRGWAIDLVEIEVSDWSAEQLAEAVESAARAPFDLLDSAAMRVRLYRRSATEHVLLLALPHIAADLWSLIVVMDELRAAYAAEHEGRAMAWPPLPIEFEDVVLTERRALADETRADLHSHLRHWRETLGGELPLLDLPLDHARPAKRSFRGGTVMRWVDADLTAALDRFAAAEGATPFMALLAAYQLLLNRYTGQDDLITGIPSAGRQAPGLAGLVGDLVNMLPIRVAIEGGQSFRQLLAVTRAAVIAAMHHQDVPFSAIVEAVQPQRDLSRAPIFQTSFVLQKFHRYPELQRALLPSEDEPPIPFADLTLEPWQLAQQDGQFDLNLEMKRDDRGRLAGAWKYAAELFEPDSVAQMAATFETLLRQVVAAPDQPVGTLSLLSAAEAAEALAIGEGPCVPLPEQPTLCALFEARAAEAGDAIAVQQGDAAITYAELAARVTRAAHGLAARGVQCETLVAVAMPRGIDLVTALLAVGKAGGAFLPLDPGMPAERLAQLIADAKPVLVLTDFAIDTTIPRTSFAALDGDAACVLPVATGSDLAYVMYTSGSTGRPKGAMIEHRGTVNHALAKLADLGFGPDDALAQNAPQSFDVVVWQCLAPLAAGGRVVIVADDVARDPAALLLEIPRRRITVLQAVPSMLRALIEEAERHAWPPDLTPLAWIVPTGEALPAELCRRWLALYPGIPLLNTYGSTECSDDQCHYRLDALDDGDAPRAIVSIGRPIANMAAHVLDANRAPVPPGVVGELHIGGIGVGRGYRGDAVRTAAAFVTDPRSAKPLYRTRDLARRRADGRIDFLGRVDQMIKLNGLRIEPAEIETALCCHPGIAEAVVVARETPTCERVLVAYLVGSAIPEAGELTRFLARTLPQPMLPARFVTLDAIPLTPNGKLDQRRLPMPGWEAEVARIAVAPRNPIEARIAAIWGPLLQRERVGVTEDFFASGGDSIRSVQLAARCRQAGLPVEPLDLFVHRTIAALAAHLDVLLADGPAVSKAEPAKAVPAGRAARAASLVRFAGDPA